MRLRAGGAALASLLLLMSGSAGASSTWEVDPFIGADGHGNTVPGAKVPFGFANPSPDTDAIGENTSGYSTRGELIGFSQTHVSGTAGSGKYGNFRVMPMTGPLVLEGASSPKADEVAHPGYYAVSLPRYGVRAELTASRLAAVHRYSFPAERSAHLVLDATSVVSIASPYVQRPVRAWVRNTGPRSFEGAGKFSGGWGAGSYTLYFAGRLSRAPARMGAWRDGARIGGGGPRLVRTSEAARRAGLFASWRPGPARAVELRLGLSWKSARKARRNVDRQLGGASFERVRERAERKWQDALGRVEVAGGSHAQRQAFASALYRSHYMPHDLRGENAWWRSSAPHYEDYFTLWDTFRTQHPLLTLVQPRRQEEMVQSLVETYEHTGWMPDGRIAGNNGLTQVGSNADVLVADALTKGLGGIDYTTAYRALRKNGEVPARRHWLVGRELDSYATRGYVHLDQRASASRTLEYAYNDFAIAQVAELLGDPEAAARYRERSRNWTSLWDPETRSIRPRHADGSFLEFFSPDSVYYGWEKPFYEGSARQYTTWVPHDMHGLIERLGGDSAAVGWLDHLFAGHFDAGNQPSMLAPFVYIHAGRHDRTADRLREVLATEYGTGRSGLPGNDDAGSLSAWYVWAAMGLYPNAGQPWYYIGSPLFERTTLRLEGGHSFTIAAPGTSHENRYVRSATLDGRPIERAFITHEELMASRELRLEMGSEPSGWGSGERPPSLTPR